MNIQSPERVEKLSISTECEVSLRIQSECGKIRTRKKLPIWTLFTQWRIQKKRIDYSQNILYLNIISHGLLLEIGDIGQRKTIYCCI